MESDGGREGIRPATAEEEALKRNTDCVYFLASPLTCKKGSECDYRHSEGARINPRDCWYWLNGNCLNPKCSFRHPPLDSLFVSPRPNSAPVQAPNRSAAPTFTPAVPSPQNGNKQNAPCYYFQRGQCLKGERCLFMHGPQPSVDFVLQHAAKATLSAEPRQINEKSAQKKIITQQNVAELNLEKTKARAIGPVGVSSVAAKITTQAENAPKQESFKNKIKLPPQSFDDEHPALPQNGKPINSVHFQSLRWGHQVQSTDEENEDGKDGNELVREHSPGFDVLVEDDIEEPDYYHGEDTFKRVVAHSGQNVDPEDEYEYHRGDYEPMSKLIRDRHNGFGEYDSYEQPHGRYGVESNSFRILDRPPSLERQVLDRETKSDAMEGSDLRFQLIKRRRFDALKSSSNRGGPSEHYGREEQYAGRHRHLHTHDDENYPKKSISSRLRGRITFPGGPSSDAASNLLLEKERGRRLRGRLSPINRMNSQLRHPERLRQQPSEDFIKDERIRRNKAILRDGTNSLDFASPMSLVELKGTKANENFHEIRTTDSNLTLNKVNSGEEAKGTHEPKNALSFEGPKPLSVILKRKRELANAESEDSIDRGANSQGGGDSPNEIDPQLEATKEANYIINKNEAEEVIPEEDELAYHGPMETEDGMILGSIEEEVLENAEEEGLENFNKQDDGFDYESEEYRAHENEKAFSSDDDLDDDDFATKVSAMLS
ncbi:zinc finger CCCH domain-containing protein 32-like [Curcuma longa]|uniref:zinc finger CCCH domain-containing protein 32-like n=1 Tax=Curcuma longa TaxID=136217 RepID=UPI003D9F1F73